MAKNSNEWMLGSSVTIDRLSAADSVDLRKIVNGNLAPLLVVVFTLSVTIAMYSQVTDATLSGTTTDPFGGAIPGAQISITNTATGARLNNGFWTTWRHNREMHSLR